MAEWFTKQAKEHKQQYESSKKKGDCYACA